MEAHFQHAEHYINSSMNITFEQYEFKIHNWIIRMHSQLFENIQIALQRYYLNGIHEWGVKNLIASTYFVFNALINN